jgi:hypothetical protein
MFKQQSDESAHWKIPDDVLSGTTNNLNKFLCPPHDTIRSFIVSSVQSCKTCNIQRKRLLSSVSNIYIYRETRSSRPLLSHPERSAWCVSLTELNGTTQELLLP